MTTSPDNVDGNVPAPQDDGPSRRLREFEAARRDPEDHDLEESAGQRPGEEPAPSNDEPGPDGP